MPANLKALHAELEKLFRLVKPSDSTRQRLEVQQPTIVIRGK